MRSQFDRGAPSRLAKELQAVIWLFRRRSEMVRFKELPEELRERRIQQCLTDLAFMGYLESSHSSTKGGYRIKDGKDAELVDYYTTVLALSKRARPGVDWNKHYRLMDELRISCNAEMSGRVEKLCDVSAIRA